MVTEDHPNPNPPMGGAQPRRSRQPKDARAPAPLSADQGGLPEVINAIADRVDPILKLITTVYERKLAAREADARLAKHLSWIAVAIIALVVLSAAVLTYLGKVDGSTFGFLLGLVVGYMLTYVRDAISPPME